MSVHFELANEYFRDEVREDFTVPALMKRCWGAQLKVLEEFDRVCEKHGLKWFAFCGTLLGAVRHKGFIPWDDDIDIAMLREDYEQFLRVAPLELPKGYFMINYDEPDHEYDCLTRVNNSRRVIFAEEERKAFCLFPYPAGLDLYPLDFVSGDPSERKAHTDLHFKIYQATELCRKMLQGAGPQRDKDGNRLDPAEMIAEISMITGYEFDLEKDIIRQLNILIDLTDSMNTEEESEFVANMGHLTFEGEHMMFPKECFSETLKVPYENGYINIPCGYDEILKKNYSASYAIPVKSSPHDYPYYSIHQKLVREFMKKHPGQVDKAWADEFL